MPKARSASNPPLSRLTKSAVVKTRTAEAGRTLAYHFASLTTSARAIANPMETYAVKLFLETKLANSAFGHRLSKKGTPKYFATPKNATKEVDIIIQCARRLSRFSVPNRLAVAINIRP